MTYDMDEPTRAMTVAPQPTQVALSDESRATLDRLMVVRDTLAPDLTPGELHLFAMVAVRSGLDPFARQIFAVKRAGKMTIQTGIDGYRSIAARTGEYDGQDEPTFGPDCECGKGSKHPESSTVRVYRKSMSRGVAATAYWHEYCPDPGPSGRGDQMWRKMPHVMLAKVAEALALRKAFPWDPTRQTGIGADVYTTEEMAQAENVAPASPSVEDRVSARAVALGPGMTVREFASEVVAMDPEEIRAKRKELFPDVKGVADLSDAQRLALFQALTGPTPEPTEDATPTVDDGLPPVQQGEAEPQEVEGSYVEIPDAATHGIPAEDDDSEEVPPIPLEVAARLASGDCPVLSPIDGAVCDREKGHRGKHRTVDLRQSW